MLRSNRKIIVQNIYIDNHKVQKIQKIIVPSDKLRDVSRIE